MNYLNKKDLLKEIDLSKGTYCYLDDPKYATYYAIVANKDQITDELINEIIASRANPKGRNIPVKLKPEEVVIRVMTHEHIPLDPDRKRKARNTDQSYARTNFPPFKHYIRSGDGNLIEVGRSHWKGTIEEGEFCLEHGRMTNGLATMFMLLVDRIATRGNYRGYSYIEEMKGNALVQLAQNGLMFDESRSDNPFAFYTTAVNHSFVRVLNLEKRSQQTRDELLVTSGAKPSTSYIFEHESATKPKQRVVGKKAATATNSGIIR